MYYVHLHLPNIFIGVHEIYIYRNVTYMCSHVNNVSKTSELSEVSFFKKIAMI